MKNILPLLVIGIFVLSGLGAAALQTQTEKLDLTTNESLEISVSSGPRDYTHTVLVEVGTATWCPSCPASNTAWHSIYEGGNYDFEYTELVYDMNSVASSRFNQFNPRWVPTSYWDGGYRVYPGTNYGTYYNYLDQSGARAVPDLVASLDVTWLGGAEIQIDYNVDNNDASSYPGRLRIYVLELESTLWDDYSGNPYYHAFLDFAENKVISIPASGSISDSITWDGASSGYPGITQDNIQVILAVFDDEGYTSYSDPPSGNPFTAYYSDECIAAEPAGSSNDPPETPDIDGPASGKVGVEYDYTFVTTDPNGDNVFYCVDWDDDMGEVCIGPFASGDEVTVSHTWTEEGTYTVRVKAQDTEGAESAYATLDVTMPLNQQSSQQQTLKTLIFQIFELLFQNI
jgi:hypothetical protein